MVRFHAPPQLDAHTPIPRRRSHFVNCKRRPVQCQVTPLTALLQLFSSLPISLRKTTLTTGSCYGSLVAQSGSALGSSKRPHEPRPQASQAPRPPTTRLATRKRRATRMRRPARSRHASSSSPRQTRPTPSTTGVTGSECVAARRQTEAAVKSCQ